MCIRDRSNAAFWLSAGALGRHSVTVRGVTPSSIQGDRAISAALMLFGAKGPVSYTHLSYENDFEKMAKGKLSSGGK